MCEISWISLGANLAMALFMWAQRQRNRWLKQVIDYQREQL